MPEGRLCRRFSSSLLTKLMEIVYWRWSLCVIHGEQLCPPSAHHQSVFQGDPTNVGRSPGPAVSAKPSGHRRSEAMPGSWAVQGRAPKAPVCRWQLCRGAQRDSLVLPAPPAASRARCCALPRLASCVSLVAKSWPDSRGKFSCFPCFSLLALSAPVHGCS